MIDNRDRWYNIFSSIQYNKTLKQPLPDGVWFTSIRGIDNITQPAQAENNQSGNLPGAAPANNKPAGPVKVTYIEFQGFIIVRVPEKANADTEGQIKTTRDVYDDLRKYIETCGIFEPFSDHDNFRLDRQVIHPEAGQNISSFKIEAKLKVPFEK